MEDAMEKSSLFGLAVFSVVFLSYPLLAQDRDDYSNHSIKKPGQESPIVHAYGIVKSGSKGKGGEASQTTSKYTKYGPAGYGTETEGYGDEPKNQKDKEFDAFIKSVGESYD